MKDPIDRQAALKGLENLNIASFYELNEHSKEAYTEVKTMLNALPPAQQERKKGRWIDIDAETYTWKIRCDQCGHERSMLSTGQTYPRFCENCGSDMRGDSNG